MTTQSNIRQLLQKNLGLFLFLGFALIGIINLNDYGISWDEPRQHWTGTVSYDKIHHGDRQHLQGYKDRAYGVAVELPLIYIEKILGLKDTRDIYLMRHLVTHFLFLLSAWCFYLLVLRLYQSRWLAVLGFLAIALHPRLYAHSFFNSKDVPFMALFIIALWLAAIAFDRKGVRDFIWLGIITGLLINARVLGILMVAGVSGLMVIDLLGKRDHKQVLRNLGIFIGVTALTLYASFPFLWVKPFANFVAVFEEMSKYPWTRDVLFMGQILPANEVPWYYSLAWFGNTTPIILLIGGIVGIATFLVYLIKKPLHFFRSDTDRNVLLHLAIFIAPFVAIMALDSNVYDGWRQVYFVYPAFILLLMYGVSQLRSTKVWIPVLTVLSLSMLTTAIHLIQLHPHQQVYFNILQRGKAHHELRQTWEMDYWGASYLQGLEYILEQDDSDTIKVAVSTAPGEFNQIILPQVERVRLQYTEPNEADYFLTNYRWHPKSYSEYEDKIWKEWRAYGSAYMTVFKLKD